MRILVTGSRDWNDLEFIEAAMIEYVVGNHRRNVTLVSGACPTGADRLCEAFAASEGWMIERHPAQWIVDGVYNRAAGYVRNAEMVNLGADICLAFIKNNSKGASMTAKLADKAGIRTVIFVPHEEMV